MSKSKVSDSTAKDVDVPMKDITPAGNTLDAAVVSIAQLEWWGEMDVHTKLGFIVPIVLHVASQTIQFVVLYYFYMFTLEGLEDPYEPAQFNMISTSIQTSIAADTPLTALTAIQAKNNTLGYPAGASNMAFYGAVHKMCGIKMSRLLINGLALFLFFGSVMNDISGIFGTLYVVANLDSEGEEPEAEDVDIKKPPAKNMITTMALPLKLIAVVFVLLPHLVCHIGIAIAGAKLISLGTTAFTVMKAFLKIFFISKFDVELYKALTSDNFLKYMKATKYSLVKEKKGGLVEMWGSAFSTVVKVLIAVLAAYLCLFVIFDNLSGMRDSCDAYYQHFQAKGYKHHIEYDHCIFGTANDTATGLPFKETCGGAGFSL